MLGAGGYTAEVQSLWELDQSLFRTIHQGWHQSWLDPIFWVISSTGLGWVQVVLILSTLPWKRAWQESPGGILRIFQTPLRLRRDDWKQYVGPLLLAFTFASILNTGILKNLVERDRPSNYVWSLPQEDVRFAAFPSGHTATSFAIATMLIFLTVGTNRKWLAAFAILWAVLVGFSRIYRGVHWPTDVLGGAMVGVGSACLAQILLSWTGAAEETSPESPLE